MSPALRVARIRSCRGAPASSVSNRARCQKQGATVVIITPTFTANFQTNFGADSGAAMDAWAAAAKHFTDAFTDDIHINITVDAVTNPNTFGRSFPRTVTIGYAELFELLSAHASTQNDVTAVGPGGSMTATDPTNGAG